MAADNRPEAPASKPDKPAPRRDVVAMQDLDRHLAPPPDQAWSPSPPEADTASPTPDAGRRLDSVVRERLDELGIAPESAIVMGDRAIGLTFGTDMPAGSGSIALSVTPDVYTMLQSAGWEEHPRDGGGTVLKREGDPLVAAVGWTYQGDGGPGAAQEGIAGRAWITPSGIWCASVPDVYAALQESGSAADLATAHAIRNQILDAEGPLPKQVLHREIAAFTSVLDEYAPGLSATPEGQQAIWLAANGAYGVYTLHNHPEIGRVNPIYDHPPVVDAETGKSYTEFPSFYHGRNVLEDARALQHYATVEGASAAERLDMLALDPYADLKWTGNRGPDEAHCARLFQRHADAIGYPRAERGEAINATVWDEKAQKQAGGADGANLDIVTRGLVGVDLNTIQTSVADRLRNSAEHMFRGFVKNADGNSIGGECHRRAEQAGVRIRCTEDFMAFLDTQPDLKACYAQEVLGSAAFVEGYRFPAGWPEDRAARAEIASQTRELADLMLATSAREAWAQALAYDAARTRPTPPSQDPDSYTKAA